MEFIDFIQSLPKQKDKYVKAFIKWMSDQKDFPRSSDPLILAQYLYEKLDWDLTLAYQKLFVIYENAEQANKIPHKYKGEQNLLNAINIIVGMKNKAGHNPAMPMPVKKIKATYPFEFICFFPCEVPTQEDGDYFVFMFVDAYSQYLFMTGIEKHASDKAVLKHLYLLAEHENFKTHIGKPFTIVFHKYEHLHTAISSIIFPLGGKMLVSDAFVEKVLAPVVKDFYRSIANPKA